MASTEILSAANILQEIKEKSAEFLKNNEYIKFLMGKISANVKARGEPSSVNGQRKRNQSIEDITCADNAESVDPLENILLEKMKENARLKMLNDRLVASNQQKTGKIKELTRALSLHHSQAENIKTISSYKDRIERCNVEIQNLKKQLSLDTKKLNSEKTKVSRRENNQPASKVNRGRSSCPKFYDKTPSFKDLDEMFIRKTLTMIQFNDEPDIYNETLAEPEGLDSLSDEEY